MRLFATILAIIVVLCCLGILGLAAEFYVKQDGAGDFASIQDAIDAAVDGDTVIVYPGNYCENIRFNRKNIVLRSTDPEDDEIVASTIIDGGRKGSVVTFVGTEDETCLLSGFTVRKGKAEGANGGGICGGTYQGTHAGISNCTITGSGAEYGGGLAWCSGTIANCTISGNGAEHGGGLCECNGDIVGCKITRNSASRSGGGLAYCNGRIIDCTISNNRTITEPENTPFGGGGIYACDGLFINCLIYDNYSTCYGGGVWASDGTFANCIFKGNRSAYAVGGIDGFCAPETCRPTITNCTFVANYGAISDCFGPIRNCIIWNNAKAPYTGLSQGLHVSYCCISNWHGAGLGNTSEDPMFVTGPLGDFCLDPNSPCIDAGYGSAQEAGLSDRTTQADGTPDTGMVDMGYHYPIPEGQVDVEVICSLNTDEFSPGDLMQGYLAVENAGAEATVDVFVGFILPDGAVHSWTFGGLMPGIRAWMGDVTLSEGFNFGPEMVLQLTVPGNIEPGVYAYAAAVAPSASPFDFLSVDFAAFTISNQQTSPTSRGDQLETMSNRS